jgi:phosphate transport system substrate-binding protein
MNRLTSLLGAAFASIALLAGTAASAQQITGAGATFPNPIYQKWGEAAQKANGIQLNYQSVGSGAGLTQARNRTVDLILFRQSLTSFLNLLGDVT